MTPGATSTDPPRPGGGTLPAASPRSTILVVDDRESNLLAWEAVLGGQWEVARARSGEQALRLLLAQDFALVLLDVQMPGMDGFETLEAIRGRPRTRELPVLLLTAHLPSDAEVVRGYALGASDILVKPVPAEVLCAKVGLFVELEERRRREERIRDHLLRSSAELGRFAEAAAHDLQAPLRSLEYLLDRVAEAGREVLPAPVRADLDAAREESARMRRLIRGLLDYAEARAGEAHPESVDASALVAEAWRSLRAEVESTGATLTCEPLPGVRADPLLLRQVFQNLFENAIRFRGEAPPRVHVASRSTEAGVELSVRDEGIGIPPQHHRTVFEPFRRLGPRRRDAGNGLGLAICREIVERNGGSISVDSEPGRGATFRLKLPPA